jgi:glycosyltransferase involved in cell wall biosynthesis
MTTGNQPLQILHMLSSGRWTGAAEPAATVAGLQQEYGHHVDFACIGGSSLERKLEKKNLNFLGGFHFDRRLSPAHLVADIRKLKSYLRENRTDIIHCHLPHDHWCTALALRTIGKSADLSRIAIIRTCHREGSIRGDVLHRWLFKKGSDRVITVSSSVRQQLVDKLGLDPDRLILVRGSVDLERFRPGLDPRHIRKIFRISDKAHVAGLVARMQPHRGHHQFLDTIEVVSNKVPDAVLVVAGRGEIKHDLLDRINNHALGKHLIRINYRKHDLPETYAGMNVAVILAPGSDGSCRAMLEAMACGRPVIGADIGAIADTIDDGVNGWLVPENDGKALAQALIDALSNPAETEKRGGNARKYIEQFHSAQLQYETTMQIYRSALEK